jgi:hypothetical protein
MIAELKISYIFQLSLDWLNSIRTAINGLTGTAGVRVKWEKGIPIIQLGDNFYNFRTIDCAKPTFDGEGNLTNIEFYKVSAFCAVGKIASNDVACEECECVTP